jgi:ubiquinone/menaquinone biosynthesis C-methylase UbiE
MKDGIMDVHFVEIRDQQREAWDEFSPKWKKMDSLVLYSLKRVSDEMISVMGLQPDSYVLDVATGTGEPGLTIAERCPQGRTVFADISKGMLEIAGEKARRRGIGNIETCISDVCELPFENNSFDAVCCRFGFMFFPDMQLAASEMARVLKPGGKMAASFWNIPEKNFWITAMMDSVNRNLGLPSPGPSTPHMFRCSKPGFMNKLLTKAGINDISESEIQGRMDCKITDVYWHLMSNITVPLVTPLTKVDAVIRQRIKTEVFQAINERFADGEVAPESSAIVIYGTK